MITQANLPDLFKRFPSGGPISGLSGGAWTPSLLGESVILRALDGGSAGVRTVDGTVRVIDQSRGGDPRQAQPGRCWDLNGSADQIDTGVELGYDASDDFSRFLWVKSGDTDRSILSADFVSGTPGVATLLEIAADGTLRGYVADGTDHKDYLSTATVDDDAWHHVGMTWDGSEQTLTLWIDGSEATVTKVSDDTVSGSISPSDTLMIGRDNRASPGTTRFLGQMFDFREAARVFSDSEIAVMAAMGPGKPQGAVDSTIWYKCDETQGATGDFAYDSSGNENHGTITATTNILDTSTNTVYSFQNERGYTVAHVCDGSTDYWDHTGRLTTGEQFSASIWAYGRPSGSDRNLFGEEEDSPNLGWYLRVSTGGNLTFGYSINGTSTTTAVASSAVPDSQWNHIAISFDGDNRATLYVNGTLVENAFSAGDIYDTNAVFRLAGVANSTSTLWDNNLCDFVFEEGASWNATTVNEVMGGTVPSGAYHWKEFNRADKNNNQKLVENGTPEQLLLPRDESATSSAVDSLPLHYTGPAPRDARLLSPSFTLAASDKATIGDVYDAPTAFTVAAWFKTADGSDNAVIGKWNANLGYMLWVNNDHACLPIDAAAHLEGTTDVADDEWHFLVGTYDGTDSRIYVDGVLENSRTESGPTTTAALLYLGAYGAGTSGYGVKQIGNVWLNTNRAWSADEVAAAYAGNPPTDSDSEWVPPGAGDVAHDVGGNQYHATFNVASEASANVNTQDRTDTLTTDGCAVATRYSGTGEYYEGSGPITETPTALSVGAWVYLDEGATAKRFMGEWASSQGWFIWSQNSGRIDVQIDGTGGTKAYYVSTDIRGQWVHVAFTWDGAGDELLVYLNGAAQTTVKTVDNAVTVIAAPQNFTMGASEGGTGAHSGMLSDGVVDDGVVWSASTLADLYAGTVPSTAYRFRDGDGTEFNQGLSALTENGTPDRILVPSGAGLPVTVGPNVLTELQSLDLDCGEEDSPFAQYLDGELTDLDYDQGDDDEADVLFARVQTDGDDRIIATYPAATGAALTNLEEYTE
jgi:hypothetical protein